MPYPTRDEIQNLKSDRRPMLMLLGSVAAVAVTLMVIAYSIPEQTGSSNVAGTAQSVN